ncbi:hypothetical protein [Mesorhizobium temperatum]|uniref:Uncharacterized protein n=1 Tax=Mesorhizobium temperatum TaxID=241416 RepID=A0A271LBD3_9HYPH|nr:hypothetical protein [Mesorhizobium temperatum]PAQ05449.1 hypothetical protein CIT26_30570 [Mesorhizobium temperatum]
MDFWIRIGADIANGTRVSTKTGGTHGDRLDSLEEAQVLGRQAEAQATVEHWLAARDLIEA